MDHCCFTAFDVYVSLIVAGNDGNCKWKVPVSTWENTNLTEDWETGSILPTG